MSADYRVVDASVADCAAIAAIYNQGIRSRTATFETEPRDEAQIRKWIDGEAPIVKGAYYEGWLAGFAIILKYKDRACYSGVAEFSVYVDQQHRGKGAGYLLMDALLTDAAMSGYWKLLSRVFPENVACRKLLQRLGFREVGTYERHAQLSGRWRDVIIVERLLHRG